MYEITPAPTWSAAHLPAPAHQQPDVRTLHTHPVEQPWTINQAEQSHGAHVSAHFGDLFQAANEHMNLGACGQTHWSGGSGATITGEEVAQHLAAVRELLEKKGWDKHDRCCDVEMPAWNESWSLLDAVRTLWEMARKCFDAPWTLDDAIMNTGRAEVAGVTRHCVRAILSAAQGANCYSIDNWAERPGITLRDVQELLHVTAEFARRCGPGGAGGFGSSFLNSTRRPGLTAY